MPSSDDIRVFKLLKETLAREGATIDEVIQGIADPHDREKVYKRLEISQKFGDSDLHQRFVLYDKVGSGQTGTVYRALEKETRRLVAIKQVNIPGYSPKDHQQLIAEAQQASQAGSHDAIVKVLSTGRSRGIPYLAMELCDGDLKGLVTADDAPCFTQKYVAELIQRIAGAVGSAHSNGVFHCDIKPSNVLYRKRIWQEGAAPTYDFYLSDFGLNTSKLLSSSLPTSGILGTLGFASPEQTSAEFGQIDERTDIYGLGALLYWLLTGEYPFKGSDPEQLKRELQTGQLVPPRELNSDVNIDLSAICTKCLNRKQHERYATAGDLSDDLGRFLGNHLVDARKSSLWLWLRKLIQRNVAWASLAVVAFVLLAVICGMLKWQLDESIQHNLQLNETVENLKVARSSSQANADLAWRHVYSSRVHAAYDSLRIGSMDEVERWLDLMRPKHVGGVERRDFEWLQLHRMTGAEIQFEATGLISRCDLSLDGTRIAVASSGTRGSAITGKMAFIGSAQVFDTRTGQEIMRVDGHPEGAYDVCFDDAATLLASLGSDEEVLVTRMQDKTLLHKISFKGRLPSCLDLTPDGSRLLVGTWKNEVVCLETSRATEVWRTTMPFNVGCLAVSPDGSQFAVGAGRKHLVDTSDYPIWLAAVSDGKKQRVLGKHRSRITQLRFSPELPRIVTVSHDHTVGIWSTEEDAHWQIELEETPRFADFVPGEDAVAVAGKFVSKWNVGSQRREEIWHMLANFWTIDIDLQNRFLYASDGDSRVVGHSLQNLPSPLIFGSGGRGTCFVVAGLDDEIVATLDGNRKTSLLSFWAVDDFSKQTPAIDLGPVESFAWDKRKSTIVVGSPKGHLNAWNPTTKERLWTQQNESGPVSSLSFSPTHDLIACGSGGNWVPLPPQELQLRRASDGELLHTFHGHLGRINSVAFHPVSSILVSAAEDGSVRLWNVQSRKQVGVIEAQRGPAYAIAFSPDGNTFAVGYNDGTVSLYNSDSRAEQNVLKGHSLWVNVLAYSPNGKRLVTAGRDREMRIWDAATGDELAEFTLPAFPSSVTFAADGSQLWVGDERRRTLVWRAAGRQQLTVAP